VQPAENLTDVGHRTPPSRHSSPPGVGVLQLGFRVTARTRKESGHAPLGGSLWPPLGGSAWVTLPGSVWATPGGSASPTPVAQYGVAADISARRRWRAPAPICHDSDRPSSPGSTTTGRPTARSVVVDAGTARSVGTARTFRRSLPREVLCHPRKPDPPFCFRARA